MRVKKLNVNRRHKPGEDEAAIRAAANENSEQRKWVSPTKSLQRKFMCSSTSSPTDVHQQQQQVDEHSTLQVQMHNNAGLLVDGTDSVAMIPDAAAADIDVEMQEEKGDMKPMRSAMVNRIVETLQAMKPHAPKKVLAALPRLAQHMEEMLFKLAKNDVEYCDPLTLRMRIAHIQENNAKRLLAAQQQQQQQQIPEQNSNGNKTTSTLKPLTEEQARVVFQHLQSWRQKLVNIYGVAPWDILSNPTLAKVALYMPSTEQELAVCGVESDRIARFGSSLVQELQHLRDVGKSANTVEVKQGHKPSLGKRSSSESLAANKKRKDGETACLVSTAPIVNGSSRMVPVPLLPAMDSLPTLLPTVSMTPGGATASVTATGNSMATKQSQFSSAHLTPTQTPLTPFFTRLQSNQQEESPQENHMHLLAQGTDQLKKQQHVENVEMYEQEIQSLRWMLHQSQQEKSQLEQEVERLRAELQGANSSRK